MECLGAGLGWLDAKPFSSDRRNAAAQSGRGDEVVPGHLHQPVQPPACAWRTQTGRHKLFGHLFSGRYKSLLVGGEGGYLRTVCDYVHLNPVRAKLVRSEAPLRSYGWSSFPAYL